MNDISRSPGGIDLTAPPPAPIEPNVDLREVAPEPTVVPAATPIVETTPSTSSWQPRPTEPVPQPEPLAPVSEPDPVVRAPAETPVPVASAVVVEDVVPAVDPTVTWAVPEAPGDISIGPPTTQEFQPNSFERSARSRMREETIDLRDAPTAPSGFPVSEVVGRRQLPEPKVPSRYGQVPTAGPLRANDRFSVSSTETALVPVSIHDQIGVEQGRGPNWFRVALLVALGVAIGAAVGLFYLALV